MSDLLRVVLCSAGGGARAEEDVPLFKAAEREKGRTAARRNTGRALAMSALYPARARSGLTVRRANMAVKGENSLPAFEPLEAENRVTGGIES